MNLDNTTGLGCKRLTKSEEQELMSYINAKPTKYTIEGLNQEFNNLLEVYKFCKKQVINGCNKIFLVCFIEEQLKNFTRI